MSTGKFTALLVALALLCFGLATIPAGAKAARFGAGCMVAAGLIGLFVAASKEKP